MTDRKSCSRCKVNLLLTKFNKKCDDSYYKMCIECNKKNRIRLKKLFCEHNKYKYTCKICKGSGICNHNKHKQYCIICNGISLCIHKKQKTHCKKCKGVLFCEHNKQKNHCKDCMTPEKCVKFIKKNMISCSKFYDKKNNKYDANNFIDMCFLNRIFEDYKKCYHCNIEFTYKNKCKTLVTIERLDNSIGHIKSNCVLACHSCNSKVLTN